MKFKLTAYYNGHKVWTATNLDDGSVKGLVTGSPFVILMERMK